MAKEQQPTIFWIFTQYGHFKHYCKHVIGRHEKSNPESDDDCAVALLNVGRKWLIKIDQKIYGDASDLTWS
jgi:hypothetical protein